MPWNSVSARHYPRCWRPVVRSVSLVGARGVAPASTHAACPASIRAGERTRPATVGPEDVAGERVTTATPAAPDPAAARGPAGVRRRGLRRGGGARARHHRDDRPASSLWALSAHEVPERGAGGVLARSRGRGETADVLAHGRRTGARRDHAARRDPPRCCARRKVIWARGTACAVRDGRRLRSQAPVGPPVNRSPGNGSSSPISMARPTASLRLETPSFA